MPSLSRMIEGERAMGISTLATAMLLATGTAAAAPGDALAPTDSGTVVVAARAAPPASPDIFGTVALGAGVTAYGARWRRVSAADERDPRITALAAAAVAACSDPLDRLALVHADIGRRVRWQGDLETWRVSDYWAQAGETLSRGRGDSEDIAVLKMQVLKAAGFAPRDIYLSVGRDPARGADTMLLVRVGEDFYALDDRSAQPQRATAALRFKPVITLGRGSAWIHGRRVAARLARSATASLR
jgi:predicted transglutaminase-like cysteine proteinase